MAYLKNTIFIAILLAAPSAGAVGFGGNYIAGQGTILLHKAPTAASQANPVATGETWTLFDGFGLLYGTKSARFVAAMTRFMLSKTMGGALGIFLAEEAEITFDIKNVELYPSLAFGLLLSQSPGGGGTPTFGYALTIGGGGRVFIDEERTLFAGAAMEASLFDWPTYDVRLEFGYRY